MTSRLCMFSTDGQSVYAQVTQLKASRSASESSSVSGRLPRNMEINARLLLQVTDDAERLRACGFAARTEHADQALRRRAGRLA